MSKREKILLWGIVFVLILFVPNYFYTKDLIGDVISRNAVVKALKEKEDNFYLMAAAIPANEKRLQDAVAELEAGMPDTNKMDASEASHYYLTEIARSCGLILTNLKLNDPRESAVFGINAKGAEIKSDENIIFEVKMYEMDTEFSLVGSVENIWKAVDRINDYSKYISLTSIAISDLEKNDGVLVSIRITVYMALKKDIGVK